MTYSEQIEELIEQFANGKIDLEEYIRHILSIIKSILKNIPDDKWVSNKERNQIQNKRTELVNQLGYVSDLIANEPLDTAQKEDLETRKKTVIKIIYSIADYKTLKLFVQIQQTERSVADFAATPIRTEPDVAADSRTNIPITQDQREEPFGMQRSKPADNLPRMHSLEDRIQNVQDAKTQVIEEGIVAAIEIVAKIYPNASPKEIYDKAIGFEEVRRRAMQQSRVEHISRASQGSSPSN